jgi:hypothetical protein
MRRRSCASTTHDDQPRCAARAAARAPSNDEPAAQHARWHEVEREFLRAESAWNLHYRPFVEIEGWVSSLVILIIFAFGFRRK